MTKKINIAVVGATGAVGETILSILAERKFPVEKMFALASDRSAGNPVDYEGRVVLIQDIAKFDFSQVQIALFSAGSNVSEEYVPKATRAGCIVIDNTSCFRYDPDVPLIVPEVNPEAIEDYSIKNIISNPNCSTIQMLVALKPIYDAVGIERINVATYQSVSGSGKKGIKELSKQAMEMLSGLPPTVSAYPLQIAFNVLPHIDVFQDNGYTREEMKMVWETQKIFADENIKVNPTTVRVPVFYGHSEAVHMETGEKISAKQARKLLKKAPGITVVDKHSDGGYPTAVSHAAIQDNVFVGRIREDISHPRGLDLWIVSDNIRKGAALNAIQIAEIVLQDYL